MKPNYKSHPFSALTLALTLALSSPAALAEPVEFHIPAQSLETALRAYMEQSKAELLYSAELVRGLSANGLDGNFEPAEALQRLLTGSGLVVEQNPGGAYLLTRAPRSQVEAPQSLVVTATRTEQRITDIPAAVSVITSEQIDRRQPFQVSDVLRDIEGVDVRNSATLGGAETITIRGVSGSFAGSTSPVMLDGMPLESPVASIHVGMKVLALEDMERVEVVRGPASALYGPSAVGGVINMISKRWDGAPGAEVRLGAGSHNARSVAAAAGAAWNSLDLRVSASNYWTDGLVAQPDPDPWGGRDLEGRDGSERRYSLNGGFRPSGNQEITFATRNTEIESAWLGGHPNYRLDNDVASHDLGYRLELGNRSVVKVNYRRLRQEAHSLFDEDYYMGDGSLALAEDVTQIDESEQVDVQEDLRLSDRNLLTLGYTHALGKYTMYDDVIIDGYAEKRVWKSRLNSIFVQDEHHIGDKFTLFVGSRWDDFDWYGDSIDGVATGNDSSDSVTSPRVSALYQVTPETGIYAAAGSAYVPALNNLKFRSNTVRWRDNPDLEPERAVSTELGIHHTAAGWLSRVGMFHIDYTDKIAAITVDSGTGQRQYQNLGKAAVDGVELSMQGNLEGGWQPYFNYTYTDSRITENPTDRSVEGNRLQYVSPVKVNLGVTYAPTNDYFVTLAGRYVAGYFTDDANSNSALFPRVPDYFVADVKIGWQLEHQLEFAVAVNNFLDREYREDRFELADGANFWVELNGAI